MSKKRTPRDHRGYAHIRRREEDPSRQEDTYGPDEPESNLPNSTVWNKVLKYFNKRLEDPYTKYFIALHTTIFVYGIFTALLCLFEMLEQYTFSPVSGWRVVLYTGLGLCIAAFTAWAWLHSYSSFKHHAKSTHFAMSILPVVLFAATFVVHIVILSFWIHNYGSDEEVQVDKMNQMPINVGDLTSRWRRNVIDPSAEASAGSTTDINAAIFESIRVNNAAVVWKGDNRLMLIVYILALVMTNMAFFAHAEIQKRHTRMKKAHEDANAARKSGDTDAHMHYIKALIK